MYFLIENNYNTETFEIIDYDKNFFTLNEKQNLLQEKTQEETQFVNKTVIPFIKKYQVYLKAEWEILQFSDRKANYEDHVKNFKKNYLEKTDPKIIKYLRFVNDTLSDWADFVRYDYEIKELKTARGDQIP